VFLLDLVFCFSFVRVHEKGGLLSSSMLSLRLLAILW
jgi:hypothetical protein